MALGEEKILFQLGIKGVDPAEAERIVRMTGDQLVAEMRKQYEKLKKAHADAEQANTKETIKESAARIKAEEKALAAMEKIRRAQEVAVNKQRFNWRRLLEDLENITVVLEGQRASYERAFKMPLKTFSEIKRMINDVTQAAESSLKTMEAAGLSQTLAYTSLKGALDGVKDSISSMQLAIASSNGPLYQLLLFTKEFIDEAQRLMGIIPMSKDLRAWLMKEDHFRRSRPGDVPDTDLVPQWLNPKTPEWKRQQQAEARLKRAGGGRGGGGESMFALATRKQGERDIMRNLFDREAYPAPSAADLADLYAPSDKDLSALMGGEAAGGGLEADLAKMEASMQAARERLTSAGLGGEGGQGIMATMIFGEEGEEGWQERIAAASDDTIALLGDVSAAGEAMAGAFGNAMAAAITGEGSFKQVLAEQTKAILKSLAAQAYAKAAMETAEGIAALAFGLGPVASGHFAAAAAFAGVATTAGLAARAIPGSGSGTTATPTATRDTGRYGSAGGNVGQSDRGGDTVNINIGMIYPGGEAESGRQIARALEAWEAKTGRKMARA